MDSGAFFPISCAAINAKAHLSWKCWGFPSMKFPLHHGLSITIYVCVCVCGYIHSQSCKWLYIRLKLSHTRAHFIGSFCCLFMYSFTHSLARLNLGTRSCTTAFYEAPWVWSFPTVSRTQDVVFNLHELLLPRPHSSWSRHSLRPRLEAVDI